MFQLTIIERRVLLVVAAVILSGGVLRFCCGGYLPPSSFEPASNIIDINRATASDLEVLPGIGPKTAQAIVDYRNLNGSFANLDELQKIKGLGPKKVAAIKESGLASFFSNTPD